MAKGDGSVVQEKDKRGKAIPHTWRITVSAGRDPISKKRRRITRIVKGSKAQARKVRDEIKRDLERGLKIDGQKVTFSEFADIWAEARLTNGRANPHSVARDRARVGHVEALIGGIRLIDVDAQMIESAYSHLKNEIGLSGTSLNLVHGALKNMFKKSVTYGYILSNPLDKIPAPQRDEVNRTFLAPKEFALLRRRLDEEEERLRTAYTEKERRREEKGKLFGRTYLKGLNRLSAVNATRAILATGMRRSEALALTWADFDLEAGTVSIDKAVGADKRIKKPKTKASIRTLSLDKSTIKVIAEWKAFQASELSKIGIIQDGKTPAFCSQKGGAYNSSAYQVWWEEFRIEADFDGLLLHELRHSQATLLLASNIDIKTAQRRLGHATSKMLLDVYGHAIPMKDMDAANAIGSLFDICE